MSNKEKWDYAKRLAKYIALYKFSETYTARENVRKQAFNELSREDYFKFLGYIRKLKLQ